MKTIETILQARLEPSSNTHADGTPYYSYREYDEAPHAESWDCDVNGYVNNYIDYLNELDVASLHVDDGVDVIGARGGALAGVIVSDDTGTPVMIFWKGEIEVEA